jgi:hypothetical protein
VRIPHEVRETAGRSPAHAAAACETFLADLLEEAVEERTEVREEILAAEAQVAQLTKDLASAELRAARSSLRRDDVRGRLLAARKDCAVLQVSFFCYFFFFFFSSSSTSSSSSSTSSSSSSWAAHTSACSHPLTAVPAAPSLLSLLPHRRL